MSLTFTDIFCGAGGSSIGLAEAGLELRLAANHWPRAIETHAANFRDAEHLCADVNNYDMRRLPSTDVLWASPICTEMSPAGGNVHRPGGPGGARKRKAAAQVVGQVLPEEFGHITQAGYERTRATFHDVIRATEVHRYRAVLIENVVEVASRWELFDWWVDGMLRLGYRVQFVSVSAAHVGDDVGNDRAPQWRDRLYLVFTQVGIPLPDVDPRPLAWCTRCDADTLAVQRWKRPGRRIGKYRAQYTYACLVDGHGTVEPYVLPAAAAINWSDLGTRIGDRKRPLSAATQRRIRAGLQMFGQPAVVAHHGQTYERPGSDYVRAWPASGWPLNARTGTSGDGLAVPPGAFVTKAYTPRSRDGQMVKPVTDPLSTMTATGGNQGVVVPPFIAELRGGGSTARPVAEPLATLTAGGTHHGLTVPAGAFVQKHHGGLDYARIEHMTKDVSEPLPAVVARANLSLVVPYRKGALPHRAADAPMSTLTTREAHGVLDLAQQVEDCTFRMLSPREHLRAQRFPDHYVVTGNQGEQSKQAGNAVASNVAHWLGAAVAAVL